MKWTKVTVPDPVNKTIVAGGNTIDGEPVRRTLLEWCHSEVLRLAGLGVEARVETAKEMVMRKKDGETREVMAEVCWVERCDEKEETP